MGEGPGEESSADLEMMSDEDWENSFEEVGDNPLGRFEKMVPGDLFPRALGIVLILFAIRLIAIVGAWILCSVDAFGHGVVQGILMLIFGCPFCCTCLIPFVGEYISPLVLVLYTVMGFRGDTKNIVNGLVLAYIWIGWITMWFF